MSNVFPGVEEVIANFGFLVSILIRLDFPTLERPMKAYSGKFPFGHISARELLITNSALVISIIYYWFDSFFFCGHILCCRRSGFPDRQGFISLSPSQFLFLFPGSLTGFVLFPLAFKIVICHISFGLIISILDDITWNTALNGVFRYVPFRSFIHPMTSDPACAAGPCCSPRRVRS